MTGIFSGEVPGKLTAGDAHHKKSRGGQAEVVNRGFDRTAECNRLTATVRESIAMTGLVEFGAVGLGLVFKILLKTAAADTTRMVGTGVLGLVVIPLRRSVAKREFRASPFTDIHCPNYDNLRFLIGKKGGRRGFFRKKWEKGNLFIFRRFFPIICTLPDLVRNEMQLPLFLQILEIAYRLKPFSDIIRD